MLDPLLRRFVDAVDEATAERELEVLIEAHALPLARTIVRRKLGSYSGDRPGRSNAADLEDVIAEAMVTIVERLHAARESQGAPIEKFENYAAAVIYSACSHHLRRRYPERTRLKNRLRYLCSTDTRVAMWTNDDELVVGLAAWNGRGVNTDAGSRLRTLAELEGRNWAGMGRVELADAIVKLLTDTREPVEFETLVGAVASAAGIREVRETCDPSDLVSQEPAQDVLTEQRRFLARVWEEVGSLPLRQRIALLLNLRDANGSGILWLLPVVGVATLRQIAHLLEIPIGEFVNLWQQIPLDDAAIAQRLECSRQQVINLRMSARKRLLNHVGGLAGWVTGFSPGPR
jgi:RNA polymerase sigma factor (sigma-70 family)